MSDHDESYHLRTFLTFHRDIQQCHLACTLLSRQIDRLEYHRHTSTHDHHSATADIAVLTTLLHDAAKRHTRALTRKDANILSEDEWLKNQTNLRAADFDVKEYAGQLKEAREKQQAVRQQIPVAEKEIKRKRGKRRWEEKKRWMWEAEFQYAIEGFGVRINRKGDLEVLETEREKGGEEGWIVVDKAVHVSSRENWGVGKESDLDEKVMGGLDKVRRWDPADQAEVIAHG